MSNVPSYKQSKSNYQMIYNIYHIMTDVGRLVHRTARKYRSTYGDLLISLSTEAMVEAKTIASFYAFDDNTIGLKLNHIASCRAKIESICSTAYIWIDMIKEHDGIDKEKLQKLYSVEENIGANSDDVIKELDKIRYQLIKQLKDKKYALM